MATFIKTVKNKHEDTVDIVVDIKSIFGYVGESSCVKYSIADVRVRPYKCRSWTSVAESICNNAEYEKLPIVGKDRELYKLKVFLHYITPDQAKEAIAEAYAAIKPDTGIIDEAGALV